MNEPPVRPPLGVRRKSDVTDARTKTYEDLIQNRLHKRRVLRRPDLKCSIFPRDFEIARIPPGSFFALARSGTEPRQDAQVPKAQSLTTTFSSWCESVRLCAALRIAPLVCRSVRRVMQAAHSPDVRVRLWRASYSFGAIGWLV